MRALVFTKGGDVMRNRPAVGSGRAPATGEGALGRHPVPGRRGGALSTAPMPRGTGDARERGAWSRSRLSAAVFASRGARGAATAEQPLRDEIEFFSAVGTRRRVRDGAAVVRRGQMMGEVHLVERGALAVVGEQNGRRPILAFAVRSELCCAVPALLDEPAPWDAVALMGSSVITMPATTFTAAVRERWADRWATRTLTWLAEVGARIADLDERDVNAQVAVLLLRHRGDLPVDICCRTISDLLDLDDDTTRQVLSEFEQLGAVCVTNGRIRVSRPEVLRVSLRR